MSLNMMGSIVNVFLGQLAIKLIPVRLYEKNSKSYFGKRKNTRVLVYRGSLNCHSTQLNKYVMLRKSETVMMLFIMVIKFFFIIAQSFGNNLTPAGHLWKINNGPFSSVGHKTGAIREYKKQTIRSPQCTC